MKIKCACGCGQLREEKDNRGRLRRYICRHNTRGKNHPRWGKHHSEETKRKISKANSNPSEEIRKKMSLAKIGKNNFLWGKHHSEETKRKISKMNTGKIHSKETREKMSKNNAKFWLGKHFSKETKRKLKFARLGKHSTEETKAKQSKALSGKNNPMWGKKNKWGHQTEESKRKMSKAQSGKNHPNWQGGISFEPYGLDFNNKLKKQIRERDKFICQECKQIEKKLDYALHIHHIDYDKTNNNANNLISLCRDCHLQTNFDRKDWTKYFQEMI